MKNKFRIVEQVWSYDGTLFVVQKYSKKWYSPKYKWRTAKRPIMHGDGTELAIFRSQFDAEEFIKKQRNRLIKETIIEED